MNSLHYKSMSIGIVIGIFFAIFQELNVGGQLFWGWPFLTAIPSLIVRVIIFMLIYGILGLAVGVMLTKFRD